MSPIKIILLILVIAGVFAAYRAYQRHRPGDAAKPREQGRFADPPSDRMLDLDQCPRCHAFVADLETHNCQDK